MASQRTQLSRRALLATAVVVTGALLTPVVAQAAPDPVRALEQAAHPLRGTEPGRGHADLRALGRMIGEAKVVGLGEATHGSHEFFTMKERVFRHLVQEKGFRAFALEMSWPAGLKINEFLQTGEGDARAIAKETLSGSPWDREEFVSLIQWMREHNRRNPGRTVHFVGDDLGAPRVGAEFFDRVTGYLPALHEYYTGLRPLDDVFAYLGKPVQERRRLAERAQQALDLLSGLPRHGEQFEWAVQNARSIAQTAHFLTLDPADPAGLAEFQRFRDQAMADNVLWWQRRTGHKILVSAHNDHIGYVASDPKAYPKTQGAFLRERLGPDYLPVGFTFNQGSMLAKDTALGGDWKKFTVDAARPGWNEHTLDRVRHRDYYLDLRTAPPTARDWLNRARPTRGFGTQYPHPLADVALARAYDVLIHLHEVREADLPK
ncbi:MULTISPECIES: erythromycin esterase family protein [unclassified Crossiella]|uniref:erythromycin esterase family protein n=1 Tax=unclassified Crossiella TaxID=2620835 RepID=UPI001FFEDF66|nr:MULTISPECIES: erythromycin esterase family protein [unclassified Crossiella]MCK2237087.1 erythromycin esterase family protein [Crossiella sp. S99.2]MCK2250755.1 erythromycin esterase family protein [Crossiella sp. S99.1]